MSRENNMFYTVLPLYDFDNYNYSCRVNGYNLYFQFSINTTSSKSYLTISLADGTVILQNKELSDGRILPLNSNSPFIGQVCYDYIKTSNEKTLNGYTLSITNF